MAKVCEECGKNPQVGRSVSYSKRRTIRRFEPNLQKQRVFDRESGKLILRKLCTRCLKTMVKV